MVAPRLPSAARLRAPHSPQGLWAVPQGCADGACGLQKSGLQRDCSGPGKRDSAPIVMVMLLSQIANCFLEHGHQVFIAPEMPPMLKLVPWLHGSVAQLLHGGPVSGQPPTSTLLPCDGVLVTS